MKKITTLILIFILIFITNTSYAMPIFENRGKVLVLMYHKLSTESTDWSDYCISPETFENDIKYLVSKGYEFVKASQLASEKITGRKIAIITFDDGYDSDLKYAVPILEKYSACATFFIFGDALGKNDYLTENDVKIMSERQCAEIGNHSYMLHSNSPGELNILYNSRKNDMKIIDDFNKNGEFLKRITGKDITALSYPNGIYTENIDKKLKENGVKITFSTRKLAYSGVKPSVPVGRRTRSNSLKTEDIIK